MPIQYVPNAAAISWLALSQALDSRANMEGALFNMFASNTSVSITEAQVQASSAQRAAEDQAEQTRIQGIMGMAGAIASGATTGVCMGLESHYGSRAKGQNAENEIGVNSIDSEGTELQDANTFKKKKDVSAQVTVEPTTSCELPQESASTNNSTNTKDTQSSPSTEITAQHATATPSTKPSTKSTTNSADKTEQSKDNQADDNKARQKEYQRKMERVAQNSANFSQLVNQIVNNGLSNLWQTGFFGRGTNYIADQGKAQAAQALAQGLSAVFNGQSSLLSAALSSCDNYMNNTNGTIATLIQTSAVRG